MRVELNLVSIDKTQFSLQCNGRELGTVRTLKPTPGDRPMWITTGRGVSYSLDQAIAALLQGASADISHLLMNGAEHA